MSPVRARSGSSPRGARGVRHRDDAQPHKDQLCDRNAEAWEWRPERREIDEVFSKVQVGERTDDKRSRLDHHEAERPPPPGTARTEGYVREIGDVCHDAYALHRLESTISPAPSGSLRDGRAQASAKVRASIVPGMTPHGVITSPDGTRLFVTNGRASRVSVVDTRSRRVIASIQVGLRPWGITRTRDGRTIITANGLSNSISLIDSRTNRVVATVPVGNRPWRVALVQ